MALGLLLSGVATVACKSHTAELPLFIRALSRHPAARPHTQVHNHCARLFTPIPFLETSITHCRLILDPDFRF